MQALGFTLIALQGFDLIAAIAGEVKSPARVIPKAMLISLGVGLAIYIPLLFLAATVGADEGSDIVAMSNANPETVMANAARNFMGVTGYWLVIIAAVLSTLSALGANLLAASRVALSMANDRTLPKVIGQLHESRRTPVMAIYTSALTLIAIVLIVPDLASAGAAASLIFLIVFALAHWMSILARKRTEQRMSMLPPSSPIATAELLNVEKPFRSPWFPVLPIVGGMACAGMALFQGIAVPAAGAVAVLWLALGVLLYMALFSGRAETFDALAEAHDPALAKLRGRSPLVLVPLANPKSAPMLVAMAGALAPPRYGRVTLLSVMRPPDPDAPAEALSADRGLNPAHAVLRDALRESLKAGHRPEALITIASTPWREIRRVARTYQCAGLLLGLGHQRSENTAHLEELLEAVSCDVAFLRAPEGWNLDQAKRVLVPVGGRGAQAELRARLLGSLERGIERDFRLVHHAARGRRRRRPPGCETQVAPAGRGRHDATAGSTGRAPGVPRRRDHRVGEALRSGRARAAARARRNALIQRGGAAGRLRVTLRGGADQSGRAQLSLAGLLRSTRSAGPALQLTERIQEPAQHSTQGLMPHGTSSAPRPIAPLTQDQAG